MRPVGEGVLRGVGVRPVGEGVLRAVGVRPVGEGVRRGVGGLLPCGETRWAGWPLSHLHGDDRAWAAAAAGKDVES